MVFFLLTVAVSFAAGIYVQNKFGILKNSTVTKVDAVVTDVVKKV